MMKFVQILEDARLDIIKAGSFYQPPPLGEGANFTYRVYNRLIMSARILKMKLNDTRYGDGAHYTLTGTAYHITLNNLDNSIGYKRLWATTVWFTNKLNGEEITLDWVIGVYAMFDQVQRYIPILLNDYMSLYHTELDFNDDSGTYWEAAASVRALTKRETQALLDDDEVEIEPNLDNSIEFSVMYFGDLLPGEQCEFDDPLTNLRPDIEKIFKLNKKRK